MTNIEVETTRVYQRLHLTHRFRLTPALNEQRGRVRGAAHLGKGIIERDIEQTIPDRDAEIVLYCGGGYRSVLAADALQQMGYHRVASMGGGWRRWCELGYPTETG